MASFPFFSYSCLFNPRFENVSLALHPQNFVLREHWHKTNYPCKKFFFYDSVLIHYTSITYRQMDGRMRDRRQWYHRCLQH